MLSSVYQLYNLEENQETKTQAHGVQSGIGEKDKSAHTRKNVEQKANNNNNNVHSLCLAATKIRNNCLQTTAYKFRKYV